MKLRSSFVCQQCGYETPQWYGKCPSCDSWNSLVETMKESARIQNSKFPGPSAGAGKIQNEKQIIPVKLSEVKHIEKNRLKSGFGEFDRVMGGGIVPGSVTLLTGDPGIGKSTLLLHVLAKTGGLYVSGEESAEQIKLRAKRLGIGGENIEIMAETNVEAIVQTIEDRALNIVIDDRGSKIEKTKLPPIIHSQPPSATLNFLSSLVIIDSIQTLFSGELESMAGSVGQVRYCAETLTRVAKSRGLPLIIIGHVTKEGMIAGPKVLEHMVDSVLYLEGERFANARILRTLKNRFGPVEEVGIFEMNEKGLNEVANPSALFLQDRVKNVPGSVVTVVMEGSRPLLVEIQALSVPSQLAMPRRIANGIDYNRLQLIVAILQKRLNLPLGTFDVFVNVSGGLKIEEPAADLAVALAIVSSFKNKPVDAKSAVFGELGLLGEVRSIGSQERRQKEARRLGFTTVHSPGNIHSLSQAVKTFE